jgi:hypothetical protein
MASIASLCCSSSMIVFANADSEMSNVERLGTGVGHVTLAHILVEERLLAVEQLVHPLADAVYREQPMHLHTAHRPIRCAPLLPALPRSA